MDKKREVVIQILTKLQYDRDMSQGIIALVQSKYATDDTVTQIASFLQEKLSNMKQSRIVERTKNKKASLKRREDEQGQKEMDEIEWLLQLL